MTQIGRIRTDEQIKSVFIRFISVIREPRSYYPMLSMPKSFLHCLICFPHIRNAVTKDVVRMVESVGRRLHQFYQLFGGQLRTGLPEACYQAAHRGGSKGSTVRRTHIPVRTQHG